MEMRIAKETEVDQVKKLWDYCFQDGEEFTNYYFQNRYKRESNMVAVDEKEVLAAIHLNPHRIKLRGNKYDVSYVVGVSSFPQVRGKGIVSRLMKKSLRHMYENKEVVSILMPIDSSIYRRYGYETCYFQREYILQLADLSRYDIKNRSYEKLSDENIDDLLRIYSSCIDSYDGVTIKEKSEIEIYRSEVELEGGYIYIAYEGINPRGMMVYYPRKEENQIFVRELLYEDISTLEGFLGFLGQHQTQFKEVKIRTATNDYISTFYAKLQAMKLEEVPFMMGRVINVLEFLKDTSWMDDEFSISIKIEDSIIEENNRIFKIENKNNSLSIADGIESDITLSINEFSQLAFGFLSLDEILFLKGAKCKKVIVEILSTVYRKSNTYINEYI